MDLSESHGGSRVGNHDAGTVRRRPPTALYDAAAASQSYGTNEDDSLLPSHNEEGYPILRSYRRRSSGAYHPGYRQPQKLILGAALAWVASVMYLASLAHSILRTQKNSLHNNIMGSSMVDSDADFKRWLESQGKLGVVHKTNEADGDGNINKILIDHWKYGASDQTNEDFQKWLQTRNKYGASSSIVNEGKTNGVNFRFGNTEETQIKYGASDQTNEDFQKWLESQNKYGTSDSGSDSDFQKWLESQNKFGLKSSDLGDAYQDWLAEKNKFGASSPSSDSDFQKWLESHNKYELKSSDLGDAYQDWLAETKKYGSIKVNDGSTNVASDVRFGNSDGRPQEWSEYQIMNEDIKYDANGMYGNSQKSADRLSSSSETQLPVIGGSDSTVSTIDWPLQGIVSHSSCTGLNGCAPSNNVTVLIVYGPEYHTSISEMAWNVAIGVHAAFQNHIRHHPNSPLHGHIVYGHTSNITFSDVQDADAIIVGTPVYNGNVHPDVQNWINYWHIDADLSNKFGGAFATAGGIHAGADGTIMSILRSMMVFQMIAVGGDSWTSPFGAVATIYEV
ncbi:hypothetical protein ACHAW5_008931 [Stephanodiscus triporus]|uniref:NADPH-dependent FMN reductase-like domain-containing protein n=1 Tax=Stephanodiscus triporus TaxID=2934178 RepID=A0ABD3N0B8_9STRA